jgi:hypothetical protein
LAVVIERVLKQVFCAIPVDAMINMKTGLPVCEPTFGDRGRRVGITMWSSVRNLHDVGNIANSAFKELKVAAAGPEICIALDKTCSTL